MQEENSVERAHAGRPEDDPDAGIMRGLHKYLRSCRLGKKDCPIVLIDSFGGKSGAGFLPFEDLSVDGLQTIVLQAIGGRARGGCPTQHRTQERSRSHDSILDPPDFYIPWSMPPSTWRLA